MSISISVVEVVFHGGKFGGQDVFNLFNDGDFFGNLFFVVVVFLFPVGTLFFFLGFSFSGGFQSGNSVGQKVFLNGSSGSLLS